MLVTKFTSLPQNGLEEGAQRRAGMNTVNSSLKVPIPTLERLATYLRYLIDLEASGVETISSTDVETQTGINAAQFRKDLSYFGEFGKPGVGYNVAELQTRIARILKIDRMQPVIVIGAGNLGSALIGYPGLREHKFHIAAAFDADPAKIGRVQGELIIQSDARLREVNRTINARIAILAVPAMAAQAVAEEAIAAGVRVILNFAPLILRVPEQVVVRNVSFLQELAVLSYHLSVETGK
jgi:redox-sensing transcriptional repressor